LEGFWPWHQTRINRQSLIALSEKEEGNKKYIHYYTQNYVTELRRYFNYALGIFYVLVTSFRRYLGDKNITKIIHLGQWAETGS
jgi:hypothetical protein